jgi:hypothetical protein
MHKRSVGRLAAATIAVGAALAWANGAHADGVVNISTCQFLDTPNTVYKLTADLTSCGGPCLVVTGDRITIDMQNHAITGCGGARTAAISDQGAVHDLIVVKNGAVSEFDTGLSLGTSSRVSVIGVEASSNGLGILVGPKALVKSSVARNNNTRGISAGERSQIQQSDASDNGQVGIAAGGHTLVTMSSANNNGAVGILAGDRATISFNTANNNGNVGIFAAVQGLVFLNPNLVTQNTAMGNGLYDFFLSCPSDVTFNTSSGLPTSYRLFEVFGFPPCKLAHNN